MERILTAEEMIAVDKFNIENLGIDKEIFIERAGSAVAEEIKKRFKGGRVLVCVGKGNNGEDGKIVAEKLSQMHGFSVAILNVANGIFKLFDKDFDIIVDCIFGTGLNRAVEGKYKTAIEKINGKGVFVVACDIPSGLNGTTGEIMGTAVKADLTVAIQELKCGYFLNDGIDYCGTVVVKDIGMSVWGENYIKRLNKKDVKNFFPKLKRNIHKGQFGKVGIIGGSRQFSGAPLLSHNALTALKMGAGYSKLFVPEYVYNSLIGVNPECILSPLKCDENGQIIFEEKELKCLLDLDAISIGMGMGVNKEVYKILTYLITNYKGRLIIDADGLNTIKEFGVDILKDKKCKIVLTPHVGEFARILQMNSDCVVSDIINLSKDFARKYDIVLLVKSAVSVITDGKEVYLNTTGSSALAKGGSGDVLSGIIGGMCSKKLDLLESVVASSFLLGMAGEFAGEKYNEYTVTATDVISVLPNVLNAL